MSTALQYILTAYTVCGVLFATAFCVFVAWDRFVNGKYWGWLSVFSRVMMIASLWPVAIVAYIAMRFDGGDA